MGILQHGEGHGAVGAGVVLLVHDEAVHFRVLTNSPDIGRHNDVHEGNPLALGALGGNVASHHFIVQLMLEENLGIAAHGHQVRRNADNGINGGQPTAVRTISEHEKPPSCKSCGFSMMTE